eukprot:scaffold2066_cov63-Phaeocystis_antarctica.AAC.3
MVEQSFTVPSAWRETLRTPTSFGVTCWASPSPAGRGGGSGEVAQQERLDGAEVHLARGGRREHRGQLGAVRGGEAPDGCVDHLPVFGTLGQGSGLVAGRLLRVQVVRRLDRALVVRDEHVSHDVLLEVGDASDVGGRGQVALQDGERLLHLDARDRVAVVQVGLKVRRHSVGERRRRVLADVARHGALRRVAMVPSPRNLCALVVLGGAVDGRDCARAARADASDGAHSGVLLRRGEAGRRGGGRRHVREELAAVSAAGKVHAVVVGSIAALRSGVAVVEEARLETPPVGLYVWVAGLAHAVTAVACIGRCPRAPGNAVVADVAVGLTSAGDWARQHRLVLGAFALVATPAGRTCPVCDARTVGVASVGLDGGGGSEDIARRACRDAGWVHVGGGEHDSEHAITAGALGLLLAQEIVLQVVHLDAAHGEGGAVRVAHDHGAVRLGRAVLRAVLGHEDVTLGAGGRDDVGRVVHTGFVVIATCPHGGAVGHGAAVARRVLGPHALAVSLADLGQVAAVIASQGAGALAASRSWRGGDGRVLLVEVAGNVQVVALDHDRVPLTATNLAEQAECLRHPGEGGTIGAARVDSEHGGAVVLTTVARRDQVTQVVGGGGERFCSVALELAGHVCHLDVGLQSVEVVKLGVGL